MYRLVIGLDVVVLGCDGPCVTDLDRLAVGTGDAVALRCGSLDDELEFVVEAGTSSRVNLNAASVKAMVQLDGASTPERVGGTVSIVPPHLRTQKFSLIKRFAPEIFDLVPRTDLPCAELAEAFHERNCSLVRPCQAWESCLNTAFTEDWDDVRVEPPYPRLRMYLRPRLLAAVTPFAEPDISSKAIEGTYFIRKRY